MKLKVRHESWNRFWSLLSTVDGKRSWQGSHAVGVFDMFLQALQPTCTQTHWQEKNGKDQMNKLHVCIQWVLETVWCSCQTTTCVYWRSPGTWIYKGGFKDRQLHHQTLGITGNMGHLGLATFWCLRVFKHDTKQWLDATNIEWCRKAQLNQSMTFTLNEFSGFVASQHCLASCWRQTNVKISWLLGTVLTSDKWT